MNKPWKASQMHKGEFGFSLVLAYIKKQMTVYHRKCFLTESPLCIVDQQGQFSEELSC